VSTKTLPLMELVPRAGRRPLEVVPRAQAREGAPTGGVVSLVPSHQLLEPIAQQTAHRGAFFRREDPGLAKKVSIYRECDVSLSSHESGPSRAHRNQCSTGTCASAALYQPGLARFLPVAALFHGEVINVSGISRDAGAARTTVADYLEILEDTLLAFRLPAFEAKLRVRERRHPKLYWADAGLPRAMKRQLGPPTAEERGHLFEGWVASVLRAYRDYRGLFEDWGYWASGNGSSLEVDFILRRGKDLIALEVRSGRKVFDADLRGLRAIADLPHVVRRIVVCRGDRRQKTADGIDVLPVAAFLAHLEGQSLFP
jgi:hypothetical protein